MKIFVILSFVLVAMILAPAMAQQIQCAPPDCNVVANRNLLFPHNNPSAFFQCVPRGDVWMAVERPCQCMTFFYTNLQRCEDAANWSPQCVRHSPDAVPRPCE
ncbi:CLUMA_CG001372, isoform A [Clunio marinus]|uniref:CLUMA_CG001372, isoform A n=1 Tax=Clunio marinus TaxID=568069 RepID=A0A1J1HHR7_9DIPT|nr:CLUMA_CG001372, isoform A [Clunio marinus]